MRKIWYSGLIDTVYAKKRSKTLRSFLGDPFVSLAILMLWSNTRKHVVVLYT